MKTMICKHCKKTEANHCIVKKTEANHCIFEPLIIPDGCVCDLMTWDDEITPICDKYWGDGVEYCYTCEHDKGCHK